MIDLKNLELTEKDFQLLTEGLDAIPEKGQAGQMLGDLIVGLFEGQVSPDGADKLKRHQKEMESKRQSVIDGKKEDIAILRGKPMMLKRYLQTQGALKSVDDIINPMQ